MLQFYIPKLGKDMICNRHAKLSMEEGYMMLSIEYTNPKSRTEICNAIDEIERDMKVHPEVIHRRLDDEKGRYIIEFSDEYALDERIAGDFIDRVLKSLNITDCDCGDVIEQ